MSLQSLIVGVWILCVVIGFGFVTAYSTSPNDAGQPLPSWPDSVTLERDGQRPTLLVFVHPKCPCTRATVAELERFLARTERSPEAIALCFEPDTASWSDQGLVPRLRAIPGLRPVADPAGRLADRFGARTSGHCLLFERSGVLLFSGGITAGRGHEGANPGLAALERAAGGARVAASFPVFGCALHPEPGP